jgi:hypothetical protein
MAPWEPEEKPFVSLFCSEFYNVNQIYNLATYGVFRLVASTTPDAFRDPCSPFLFGISRQWQGAAAQLQLCCPGLLLPIMAQLPALQQSVVHLPHRQAPRHP